MRITIGVAMGINAKRIPTAKAVNIVAAIIRYILIHCWNLDMSSGSPALYRLALQAGQRSRARPGFDPSNGSLVAILLH